MTGSKLIERVRPVPAPATAPDQPVFRRDVQGLRALAVLLVVAGAVGLPGGGAGIDLFFVITGFVLTASAAGELRRNGRLALLGFYARRATRAVPAMTVVVLGTLAAAWHWMPPADRRPVSWDALTAATATMAPDPAGVSPLHHFAPLAVIAQVALVLPLVLIAGTLAWARRGRVSVVAAGLLLAGLTAASLTVYLSSGAGGLQSRAWEFGVGALIALGTRRLAGLPEWLSAALTWLGLGLVAVAVAAGSVVPAVVGAGLTIAGGCARPAWGARRLLRLKPLQELGRVSFSWYLWHWPVLVLAPYVVGQPLPVVARAGLAVAALVPAAMSVAAVENRIHLHRGLRRRPGRALALGATLTAVTAGVALLAVQVPVPADTGPAVALTPAEVLASDTLTVPQLQRIIRAGSTATALPADLTPSTARASASVPRDGGCLMPAATRLLTDALRRGCEQHGAVRGQLVVLFGDSHAQQWFEPLDVIARKHRWRLAVLTKVDCSPAAGRAGLNGGPTPYPACDQWRERALARIERLRPAMVVMSARNRDTGPLDVTETAGPDQDWAAAWAKTVTRVKRAGAVPVVVEDTPVAHRDVPSCLAAYPATVGRCHLAVLRSLLLPRQRIVRAMVQAYGGWVVDSNAWFCTPSICPAVIGDTVVYRDDNHLTAAYATRLAGVLDAALPK